MSLDHAYLLGSIIGVIVAAVVATFSACGFFYRRVLLPNLREDLGQLVDRAEATYRAVTVNGGLNDPKSVPDRLSEQNVALARIEGKVDGQTSKLDQHIGACEAEAKRHATVESDIWAAIRKLKARP